MLCNKQQKQNNNNNNNNKFYWKLEIYLITLLSHPQIAYKLIKVGELKTYYKYKVYI